MINPDNRNRIIQLRNQVFKSEIFGVINSAVNIALAVETLTLFLSMTPESVIPHTIMAILTGGGLWVGLYGLASDNDDRIRDANRQIRELTRS